MFELSKKPLSLAMVAFHSWAFNLVRGDINGASDVFMHMLEAPPPSFDHFINVPFVIKN